MHGDKATQSQHIGITLQITTMHSYRSQWLLKHSMCITCCCVTTQECHAAKLYGFAFLVVGTGVPIKHNYFVYYKHTLEGSILYCLFQEKVSIMLQDTIKITVHATSIYIINLPCIVSMLLSLESDGFLSLLWSQVIIIIKHSLERFELSVSYWPLPGKKY